MPEVRREAYLPRNYSGLKDPTEEQLRDFQPWDYMDLLLGILNRQRRHNIRFRYMQRYYPRLLAKLTEICDDGSVWTPPQSWLDNPNIIIDEDPNPYSDCLANIFSIVDEDGGDQWSGLVRGMVDCALELRYFYDNGYNIERGFLRRRSSLPVQVDHKLIFRPRNWWWNEHFARDDNEWETFVSWAGIDLEKAREEEFDFRLRLFNNIFGAFGSSNLPVYNFPQVKDLVKKHFPTEGGFQREIRRFANVKNRLATLYRREANIGSEAMEGERFHEDVMKLRFRSWQDVILFLFDLYNFKSKNSRIPADQASVHVSDAASKLQVSQSDLEAIARNGLLSFDERPDIRTGLFFHREQLDELGLHLEAAVK